MALRTPTSSAFRPRRDTILVRALLSDRQARGSVFVPIHWTDQFAAKARVDVLVHALTDPHSGQPASKHVPVRMERFAAALYGFAVISQRPLLLEADYWALAKCQAGWRVEFAFASADRDWSRFAATLLGCAAGADFVAYRDAAAGQQRFAYFADGRLAGALFLAPEPVVVSRDWAIEQLGADLVSQRARVAVVAGRPGRGLAERGSHRLLVFWGRRQSDRRRCQGRLRDRRSDRAGPAGRH